MCRCLCVYDVEGNRRKIDFIPEIDCRTRHSVANDWKGSLLCFIEKWIGDTVFWIQAKYYENLSKLPWIQNEILKWGEGKAMRAKWNSYQVSAKEIYESEGQLDGTYLLQKTIRRTQRLLVLLYVKIFILRAAFKFSHSFRYSGYSHFLKTSSLCTPRKCIATLLLYFHFDAPFPSLSYLTIIILFPGMYVYNLEEILCEQSKYKAVARSLLCMYRSKKLSQLKRVTKTFFYWIDT